MIMLNSILEQMVLYKQHIKKCFCFSWKHFWNVNVFDKYCILFTSSVIEYENTALPSLREQKVLRFQLRPRLQAATLVDRRL